MVGRSHWQSHEQSCCVSKGRLLLGIWIIQGESVSTEFILKNIGEAPLLIRSAKGSCGCTVPEWPREAVAVGESAAIKVTFNSAGKSGKQNKRVTLVTNAIPNTKVITINGNVIVPVKISLGRWLQRQRRRWSQLSESQQKKLNNVDEDTKNLNEVLLWQKSFNELLDYQRSHGDINISDYSIDGYVISPYKVLYFVFSVRHIDILNSMNYQDWVYIFHYIYISI